MSGKSQTLRVAFDVTNKKQGPTDQFLLRGKLKDMLISRGQF